MDPHARRVADMIALAARPPLGTQSADTMRRNYRAARRVLQPDLAPVASVRDLVLGGVRVRLTAGLKAQDGRCLLYCHGGGWVLGDLDSHDAVCRHLANAGACHVAAVDYRLAPEHPFPAALDDAAAVLQALVADASALGIDPARIAVGGDSAGANLAAVLTLMARDGAAPPACQQMLFYPVTDLVDELPSYTRHGLDGPLTADDMRWFAGQYVGGADPGDWRISPLRASLTGLPPAFVLTAGYDPLCDEGMAYARGLDAAGVAAVHLHMPTQIHGFLTMGRLIPAAGAALDAAGAFLRLGWPG